MRSIILVFLLFIFFPNCTIGQGYNHQWLMGYGNWTNKGRIIYSDSAYIYSIEQRKMGFEGTQGNICDAQGNFLMSSNGVWVANANNDTMLNGSGLNPGNFVNSWPNGLLIDKGNFFLPFPGDTLKYILFHQTVSGGSTSVASTELFYTSIDLSLDSGLGGVILNEKNVIILQDTISWGLTACKHANGRDWWVICIKDAFPILHTVLVFPGGILNNFVQTIGAFVPYKESISNPVFSSDGSKFAYTIYDNPSNKISSVVVSNFDRCTGQFFNTQVIPVTSGEYLWGLSFSPNGSLLYTNSTLNLYQIDLNTNTIDTVAVYDGFSFPIPAAATTFDSEYLAANGKIYLTTGGSSQHIHEINYPDSAGLACDVQQHAINLGVWHFRSLPNHPNYNLGPVVGSVCDSITSIAEIKHNFKFSISPNPTSDGTIKLVYLLPQNSHGLFEVFNITGQLVYKMNLPPWSTLQFVQLPEFSNGVYTCVVKSGYERVGKKLVLMK